ELLLISPDRVHLYLWDARTGRERPVAQAALGGLHPGDATISPDGNWLIVQSGALGDHIYTVSLADPAAPAKEGYPSEARAPTDRAVMLSDGTLVAAPPALLAEPYPLPARP